MKPRCCCCLLLFSAGSAIAPTTQSRHDANEEGDGTAFSDWNQHFVDFNSYRQCIGLSLMHERWVGNCVLIVLRWSPNNWSNWSSNSWNDAGKYRVNIVEEWKFDRQDSFCAQLADTQHAHGKSMYLFFFNCSTAHSVHCTHTFSRSEIYMYVSSMEWMYDVRVVPVRLVRSIHTHTYRTRQ